MLINQSTNYKKNPVPIIGKFPWSCYQRNQETPKVVKAIVFYLGCLTEVERET